MIPARLQLQFLFCLIVLVSLCSAALTIFSQSNDVNYEYSLLVLLFLAVIAPIINILHRSSFRSGGLLLCAVFTVLPLILILAEVRAIDSGKLLETLIVLLYTGIPAGVALLVRSKPWARFFSLLFPIIAAIAAVVSVVAIWMAGGEVNEKLIYCALAWLVFGGSGAILSINVGRGDKRYFRWPAILASVIAVLLSVSSILAEENLYAYWNSTAGCWSLVFGLSAMTGAFINILLMTRRPGLVRLCQGISITAAMLTGALGIALLAINRSAAKERLEAVSDSLTRCFNASFFLVFGGTLCLLTARELLRIRSAPVPHTGVKLLSIVCPNCGTTGSVGLHGACATCLLQFKITLTEPTCPKCDHLLLNLTSDRCPECGHPFPRPVAQVASISPAAPAHPSPQSNI